jgi:uncharacterized protein (DUF736 family)
MENQKVLKPKVITKIESGNLKENFKFLMNKNIYYSISFLTLVISLVILLVPFTSVSSNNPGEFRYCRYRLSVYEFWHIESDGEGYVESDTYFGKIKLERKIGGPLEYFGLKEIEDGKVEK